MENMITVFENEEFGAVRTAIINGEPWFVANDVLRVISVRNTKDALYTLDEDEKSGVDIIDPHGRIQRTNCISESGLYSIVPPMDNSRGDSGDPKAWNVRDDANAQAVSGESRTYPSCL